MSKIVRHLCLFLYPLILLGIVVYACCNGGAVRDLRRIPVYDSGRTKPFIAFAEKKLKFISGKKKWNKEEASLVLLRIVGSDEFAVNTPLIKVDYQPLTQLLGFPLNTHHISLKEAFPKIETLNELITQGLSNNNPQLSQKAAVLMKRITTLQELRQGETVKIIPSKRNNWSSPYETHGFISTLWSAVVENFNSDDVVHFQATTTDLRSLLRHPRRIELEAHYYELKPFNWAMIFYFCTVFALIVCRLTKKYSTATAWSWWGIILFFSALLFHSYGIVLLILILHRPPVSNMYEALVFMTWCVALMAFCFALKKRRISLLTPPAFFASFILLYGLLLPSDSYLEVLPPILRTNFFLTCHVMVMIMGYAAVALAMTFAHSYLIRKDKSSIAKAAIVNRSLQIGSLLIGTGIVLGAIWASKSWGRFWDWDPKETWALITFLSLFFTTTLYHLKKINDYGLVLGAIFCFMLVIMTWIGVNYLSSRSLHSYINLGQNISHIIIYLVLELCFIIYSSIKWHSRGY